MNSSRFHLQITWPNGNVERRPLPADEVTIGRVEGNSLVLPDVTVSRRHAKLTFLAEEIVLEDVASTSGTSVNRARVSRAVVWPGDVIRIGQLDLTIVKREEPDEASAS